MYPTSPVTNPYANVKTTPKFNPYAKSSSTTSTSNLVSQTQSSSTTSTINLVTQTQPTQPTPTKSPKRKHTSISISLTSLPTAPHEMSCELFTSNNDCISPGKLFMTEATRLKKSYTPLLNSPVNQQFIQFSHGDFLEPPQAKPKPKPKSKPEPKPEPKPKPKPQQQFPTPVRNPPPLPLPPPPPSQSKQFLSPSHLRRQQATPPHQFSLDDPSIEAHFHNAACSPTSLSHFFTLLVTSPNPISFTVIFFDPCLSTSFSPSTLKFCTPKGPKCSRWYCTCESQIRGKQGQAPLVGACFFMGDENESTFILPLGRTLTDTFPRTSNFRRMKNWPIVPFDTENVSIADRWECYTQALNHPDIKLVTFNSLVCYLPVHFQRIQSGAANQGVFLPKCTLDVRISTSLLSTSGRAGDESLEFEEIVSGGGGPGGGGGGGGGGSAAALLSEANSISKSRLDQLISTKEKLKQCLKVGNDSLASIFSRGLEYLCFVQENPMASVLSKMEATGISFLPLRFAQMTLDLKKVISTKQELVRAVAENCNFNVASPQQVDQLLYGKLQLPTQGSTAKGLGNSTSSTALSELILLHPVVSAILDFRTANKLLTTYLSPLENFASDDVLEPNAKNLKCKKRIYPQWNQLSTATGRLSCAKPNLQTIPTTKEVSFFFFFFSRKKSTTN